MALTVDINPMGKVEDVEGLGQTALTVARLYRRSGELELLEDRGRELEVRVARQVFSLKVDRVMGGNQWNVYNNLGVLREAGFADIDIKAHFGLGNPEATARKSLYLPDLAKIDLVTPDNPGELVFSKKPRDENIVISSAPHGEMGKTWWEAWLRFLKEDDTCRYYWNPARKQLDGGVPEEVRRLLHGRIGIFQVNEVEAQQYLDAYAPGKRLNDLPEVVGAEWTVVTRGAQGMRLYAGGELYDEPILSKSVAQEILGQKFCPGRDVGCGDSGFAAFIAAKESSQQRGFQETVRMATAITGLQYNHAGSNLSELRGVDISALL